jgi:lysyl-tRNA synthetase, class II
VINRVFGFAIVDPSSFTGRPHILLVAAMGFFGAVALMLAAAVWFRSQGPANALTAQDESAIRGLYETYGHNAPASCLAESRDNAVLFAENGRAAIIYRVEIGVCLAGGDPVGDPDTWPQAIEAWLRLCRAYGWTPVVMDASAAGAQVYRAAGFIALQPDGETIVYSARSKLSGLAKCVVGRAVKRARRADL